MATNLFLLDKALLAKIASNLLEGEQAALRQVNREIHQKMEDEEVWQEKCQTSFPYAKNPNNIKWRDFYLSCYTNELPRWVAFRSNYQKGYNLAPKLTKFSTKFAAKVVLVIGLVSIVFAGVYFGPILLRPVNSRLELGRQIVTSLGTGLFLKFFFDYNIATKADRLSSSIGKIIGNTAIVRKISGLTLGSFSFLKVKYQR